VNAIRQALSQITQRLSALSLSAKLLVGAVMVIALMSMVVVAGYSGRTTWVDLLPSGNAEQVVKAKKLMDEFRISYRPDGTRLLVSPEDKYMILALLGEGGALGGDTSVLFANLISSQHWMNTKSQNDTIHNLALQGELAKVISKMRGVKSATVIIDAPDISGLGAAIRRPTASVAVVTNPGSALDQGRANAIAGLVSSAKAGLRLTDVKVIDQTTGRSFSVKSEDALDSTDYLDAVAKVEERVRTKLQESLAYVPGVIVAVTAQVDNTRRSYNETKIFAEGQGSVSVATKNEKDTKKTTSGTSAGEPGARPNVGTSLTDGQGGGMKNDETKTTVESAFHPGKRVEQVIDGRGNPTRLTAMVSLPREYLAALVRQSKPAPAGGADAKPEEVTQAELDAKFKEEKARLEADLGPLMAAAVVGTAAETPDAAKVVTVSMIPVPSLNLTAFAGTASAGLLGAGSTAGSGDGVLSMLGADMIKNVVLGGFAVAAVGIMLMMVRKASRPLELPTAETIVGVPPALESEADIVGEADESQMAMEGVELPEDQVKTKKMLEQVQDMVKKNPADAAALLNLWLTAEQ
jgi:flagellar M-ring protein FliF